MLYSDSGFLDHALRLFVELPSSSFIRYLISRLSFPAADFACLCLAIFFSRHLFRFPAFFFWERWQRKNPIIAEALMQLR